MQRLSVLLFTSVLLAACATPGAPLPPASQIVDTEWSSVGAHADWPPQQWWKSFASPGLDAWMERALARNPGLQEVAARVEAARAEAAQVGGQTGPSVDLSASSLRQRYPENAGYDAPLAGGLETTLALNAELRYTLDFWGRNRAALRASLGDAVAQQAEWEAARVLLASQVASAWFDLAHQLQRRTLAQETQDLREKQLHLVRRRVDAGLDAPSAAWLSQASAGEAAASVFAIDADIDRARHALAELAGAGPQSATALAPSLTEPPAASLPDAIPAELLGRRADIAAARLRVEAASARTDEARAAFYPNVDLRAFVGLTSLGLSHWLERGSRSYGIEPAITLPLFDGGRLRAGLDQRRAAFDRAVAQYNASVLSAARGVADALSRLDAIRRQRVQQQAVVAASLNAHRIASHRYAQGRDDHLTALVAEERWLRARTEVVSLHAGDLQQRIALASALGGGFEAPATRSAAAAGPDLR